MTDLLRDALNEAESFRGVEKATGVLRQCLMKFARGETSLHLSAADKLAEHFGIECRRIRRRGTNKQQNR